MPQKFKPDRAQTTIRTLKTHLDLYRTKAAALGLSVGDYMALELARSHGLAVPGYIQEELGRVDQLALRLGA